MSKLNPASRPLGGGFFKGFLITPLNPYHKWRGITRCGVNSSREYFTPTPKFLVKGFIKKRKHALTKINSFREDFRKKENEMKVDLEKARRIWRELSERFKWWGLLP